MPTLARLLISEQPAGHLGEEAAISLFRKLQEGLKEYLKRIQHENKSLRNSSFGRHAFSTE
ncbi:MAG: hypothetical protein H6558_08755 [Lewinellaceae bacterium]|nr:hypothetical protein [Lewinellaceae bacterium]